MKVEFLLLHGGGSMKIHNKKLNSVLVHRTIKMSMSLRAFNYHSWLPENERYEALRQAVTAKGIESVITRLYKVSELTGNDKAKYVFNQDLEWLAMTYDVDINNICSNEDDDESICSDNIDAAKNTLERAQKYAHIPRLKQKMDELEREILDYEHVEKCKQTLASFVESLELRESTKHLVPYVKNIENELNNIL